MYVRPVTLLSELNCWRKGECENQTKLYLACQSENWNATPVRTNRGWDRVILTVPRILNRSHAQAMAVAIWRWFLVAWPQFPSAPINGSLGDWGTDRFSSCTGSHSLTQVYCCAGERLLWDGKPTHLFLPSSSTDALNHWGISITTFFFSEEWAQEVLQAWQILRMLQSSPNTW